MSLFVFLAVLFSAFLHALWNAYAKNSADKFSYFVVMSATDAVIALFLIFLFPDTPFTAALPYIILTAFAHVAYRFLLCTAYETGDLGFIYPICRGIAPLIVLVLSLLLIGEAPSWLQLFGITFISFSILSFGLNCSHHGYKNYIFALLTGLSIACYSFFGGMAARVMDNAWLAIAYITIIDAPAYIFLAFAYDKKRILDNISTGWKSAVIGGAVSFVGYCIATWAMTQEDMSSITALRATSVLFATIFSVYFLKEQFSMQRVIAAVVIVGGIALIKIG